MSSRKKSNTNRKTPRPAKKKGNTQKILNRIGLVLVAAFMAFALYVIFTQPPPEATGGPKLPQRVGSPWEYDERFNAYWDPREGHEHWHEGEPPAVEDR